MAHEDVCISHCSLGWSLTGDAFVLQCKDGLLDGNIPQCDPVPCTYNLPSSIGVKHNCSGIATGGTCVASCSAEGFTYASGGEETFECLPTGEFQGQSPSCVPAACRDLTLASRFEHRCSNMVYGDSCSVGCAAGFVMANLISLTRMNVLYSHSSYSRSHSYTSSQHILSLFLLSLAFCCYEKC